MPAASGASAPAATPPDSWLLSAPSRSLSGLCLRAEIGIAGSVTRNLNLLAVRGLVDVCPATTGCAKQLYAPPVPARPALQREVLMRLRLLVPTFVAAMAIARLTFPETHSPTAFWQLPTFSVVSLTAAPLLPIYILARITDTEV